MSKIKADVLSALTTMAILIGFGTWAFGRLENWSLAEAFYFSVATLTTVGYGDIHPTTDGSRIFTAIYILIGVGIFIAALTSIGSSYLASQEKELSNKIASRINKTKK